MANKHIKKIPVDKEKIMEILSDKEHSIRSLGHSETGIGWSEKTIRRGLNDGLMTLDLLNDIAKRIEIDPTELTDTCLNKGQLTQEELEWLEVGRNLKKKSVRELIYDLELGGNDTDCSVSELRKLYSDDEDDEE